MFETASLDLLAWLFAQMVVVFHGELLWKHYVNNHQVNKSKPGGNSLMDQNGARERRDQLTLGIFAVCFFGSEKKYPVIVTKLLHKPLNFQDPTEPEPNQDDAWSMFCRGLVAVAQVIRVDEWVGNMGCFFTFDDFLE